MPPPSSAWPWVMVRPARKAVTPLLISKTRLASLPLTATSSALGPRISRSSVTSSWPPGVIVPCAWPVKKIRSAPGWALASSTACRSDPGPLSARFSTRNVLGTVRSSRASSRGVKSSLRCRFGRRPRSRRVRWESDFRQERKESNHMIHPPFRKRSAMGYDNVPGAQTERRGGAGPAGGLSGGKEPAGRFVIPSPSNQRSGLLLQRNPHGPRSVFFQALQQGAGPLVFEVDEHPGLVALPEVRAGPGPVPVGQVPQADLEVGLA